MKNIYFLILFLVFSFFGKAQNNYIKNSCLKKSADSLIELGSKMQDNSEFAASLRYFEGSLKIYQHLDRKKEIGDTFSYIALTNLYLGDYEKALDFYDKGLIQYKNIYYDKGISSVLNNVGGIYYYLGNYPKALENYKNAIIFQEKIGDKKIAAATTQNIGVIYSKVGDYINAMKYYNKAYNFYKKTNNQEFIAKSLNSIGYTYIETNEFVKAEKNLNQSHTIAKKINNKQVLTEVLSNLGVLFYKKNEYQNSLFNYNSSLKYANEINSLQYQTESKVAIGNIHNRLGENYKAIQFCKAGLKMAEKLGSISVKKDACDCLYDAYKSTGNNNLALNFYEKSNLFQDSLQSEETANKMMDMEFQNKKLLDSITYVKKAHLVQLKHTAEVEQKEKQRNMIIVSLLFILLIAVALWSRLNFVKKAKKYLQFEKDRSEQLLLNILPEEIAQELKEKGSVNARDFNLASILFTDFKSFTQTAEKMSPQDLVEEINVCFKAFDLIAEEYNIEKIKTIGDAYMAAGGIPVPDKNSLLNIVLAGLEMQEFVRKRKIESDLLDKPSFEMRLGIHAGPIIAGIVGIKKFQYDVWGDTVNTASRLESNGMVGKVNISESLYNHIKDDDLFTFEYRGKIYAKGKGEINMYFVEKRLTSLKPTITAELEFSYL